MADISLIKFPALLQIGNHLVGCQKKDFKKFYFRKQVSSGRLVMRGAPSQRRRISWLLDADGQMFVMRNHVRISSVMSFLTSFIDFTSHYVDLDRPEKISAINLYNMLDGLENIHLDAAARLQRFIKSLPPQQFIEEKQMRTFWEMNGLKVGEDEWNVSL